MASSMGQRSESMSPANYSMGAPPRLDFRWQERAPSSGGQYTEGPGPKGNQMTIVVVGDKSKISEQLAPYAPAGDSSK